MSSNRNWDYEYDDDYADEDAPPDNRATRALFLIMGALLLLVAAILVGVRLFGARNGASAEGTTQPAGSGAPADHTINSVMVAQSAASPEEVILQMTAQAQVNAADNTVVVQPVVPVVSLTTVPRPPISLETPASILSGILHGIISPFTFVMSLVTPTIRMYDPTNVGWMYDIGFLIGLLILAFMLRLWWVGRGSRRRRRA